MKTLKEKRGSLRSLWRGSLVVFCLLALVLASCTSDDNGNTGTGGGVPARTIMSFTVLTDPTATNFQGLPVDLSGIRVGISFINEEGALDFAVLDDPTLFAVIEANIPQTGLMTAAISVPTRYFINYNDGANTLFVTNYTIMYVENNVSFTDTINVDTDNMMWVDRLNFTGVGTIRKTEYYIDDTLDFGGLLLEANYVPSLTGDMITMVIPFSAEFDGNFAIRPASTGTIQGGGSRNLPDRIHLTYASVYDAVNHVWISAREEIMPLDAVHYATELRFEVVTTNDGPFFFDDDDTHEAWLRRFNDASINVTYSNGSQKTFTVEAALAQTRVFLNSNPQIATWWNQSPTGPGASDIPFYIMPVGNRVHNPSGGAANAMEDRDPKFVEFYYRGVRFRHPITVYNRLETIEVEQDPITIDFRPTDNDRVRTTVANLAANVRVTGVYSSTANADAQPARREIGLSDIPIGTSRGNDGLWYFDYDRPATGTTIPNGFLNAGTNTDGNWNASVAANPLVILAQRFDVPRRDGTEITLNVRVAGHGPGSGRGGRGTITTSLITNP